ncbi:MAG: hypothetical protein AUK47_21510 [Deltaproteobacteria bacterium CG2_30_63_29]|nr:MAG: hypothetical protein AUK47_21510 [Deltaproteobacteria bacterium CG2_30_63_29]PJB33344.1 MAG: hypothetical protein CO108_31110 [Deltaproteobacteria bacterium CG_4_9_14_3_um_filter_63_12]
MFAKNPALSFGRALWAAVLAASLLISTNGLASPPKGGGEGVAAGVGHPDQTAEGRDDDDNEADDGGRDRDHRGKRDKKAKKDKKGKRGSDEAISDDDFDEMVKYLKGKEKERKRLGALESEAKNERFSTTQAVELIDLFEGDGRVDAAIILYPALTDPQRFHRVLGEFKRTSDRKSICKELDLTLDECGDDQPIATGVVEEVPVRKTKIEVVKVVETPTLVAMSDADFNEMVSSFDNASFSDDKLRVIKTISPALKRSRS